jgi:hypothetical protein
MSDAPYVMVTDDGRVEYRASALGGCDLALLAARLGYDAIPVKEDAKILQVFAAGKRIEDEVLTSEGFVDRVTYQQARVVLPVTKKIVVVGHVDGYDKGDWSIYEVKSQNKEEWDRFNREGWESGFFPKYKWQVSAYMHATLMPLKLVRALRDNEGNWTGEIDVSVVDEPFYTIPEIRARVLRVEAASATGVLSAECTPSFPCPYFYLHEEIDRELVSDESVDALAREYAEAQRDERIAEGRKQNARRGLREAVEKDKYVTSSGVRVSFYQAKNPPKLDREMLEEFLTEHDRKFDEFVTTSMGERVRVTLPKEDEDGEGTVSRL